jgi:hypothetical protein
MRRITICIAAALLACSAVAATASAKVKSRTYGVGQDFRIAGKTLKAGTYRFSFDDEKNELTVTDRKTGEVVARTEARTESLKEKAARPELMLTGDTNAPLSFAGLSFDGKQVIRASAAASLDK